MSISAVLTAAIIALPSVSQAQVATVLKPVRVGVAAGAAVPLGDFGKSVSTGFNVTGTVDLKPPTLPVGFRLDAGYNQFNAKGGGATAKILGVTGNVVLMTSAVPVPEISPYFIGGLGWYHETLAVTSVGSASQNHFGFNAGAGINIPLTGFNTFIEARYNWISQGSGNGSTSFIPITVGIMF